MARTTARTVWISRLVVALAAALLLALGALPGGVAPLTTPAPAAAVFPGSNGKIVFVSDRAKGPGVDNPDGDNEIFSMNPDGSGLKQLTENALDEAGPVWSPDGRMIAFSRSPLGGRHDIVTMRTDGTGERRLTRKGGSYPTWSPDGKRIAFVSSRNGNLEVYTMRADGSQQTNITHHLADDFSPDWSPDGTRIAFATDRDDSFEQVGDFEVYAMRPDGSDPKNITKNTADEFHPAWSPDGARIAYSSRRNDPGIYTINADGTDETVLVDAPNVGEAEPAWSPNGRQVVFTFSLPGDSNELYVVGANGGGPTRLTNADPADSIEPDWQRRRG